MATTKNSVIINGVTLTRAQVEAALKDLNTPAPQPMVSGTVIMPRGSGLVWDSAHLMLDTESVLDAAKRAFSWNKPFVGVRIPLNGGLPEIGTGEGQRDLATDCYWREATLSVTAKKED